MMVEKTTINMFSKQKIFSAIPSLSKYISLTIVLENVYKSLHILSVKEIYLIIPPSILERFEQVMKAAYLGD